MKSCVTIQGDKWDSIALRAYGSTSYIGDLMEANASLAGTYIFPAGVKIVLPELAETKGSEKLPPWKR